MSPEDGIRRFLDNVDPKILARGEDYYHSGQVESVDWEGDHVTAEVSGSEEEPYLVGLDFSEDGELEDWFCDCPYDWGPVCKHTVAVLLAIQAEPSEKPSKRVQSPKINILPLLKSAKKEQLVQLILEHCQEDQRFQNRALSELEDSGEQELAAVKTLVEASICSNTHRGYIDMRGCDHICADLDDILDQARRRIKQGRYDQALDITLFVLLTAVKLVGEVDSSSGSLSWTIDAALETVELAANGRVQENGPREEFVRKILKAAENSAFDGWDHWRYDLLQRAAILANSENEEAFFHLLDRLSDQIGGNFQDAPRYGYAEEDKITRYSIIRSARGPKKARMYLEQNLDVDELRVILVREDMVRGDHAHAEFLCRERLEKEQKKPWFRPSQWQYLLYEIYRDGGQSEKQICQARKLALLGDRDFYQTTKELLMKSGRWQEEYPGFLVELKAARPAYEYMEILKLEGETALLMEQVRLYPETVFQYGGTLVQPYGEEIFDLCAAVIREQAKRSSNRKEYQKLCTLIESLAGFGRYAEAQALITELRQSYPRRPALLDELGNTKRAILKRMKDSISYKTRLNIIPGMGD